MNSSTPVSRRETAQPTSFKTGEETPVLDKLDKYGNYKIYKNVQLPKKGAGAKYAVNKMKVGDCIKAESMNEAIKIYTVMRSIGYAGRQYKTGQGFWWVQRVK